MLNLFVDKESLIIAETALVNIKRSTFNFRIPNDVAIAQELESAIEAFNVAVEIAWSRPRAMAPTK